MAVFSAACDPMEDICEEATCSICLEYFKDPVSVECGHNFCRDCVTQCWEKSGTSKTFCPQCRKEVLQNNLRPNWPLANIVEITKNLSIQEPKRAEGRERVCGKHQEPLKLFCKEDNVSLCVVCDRSKEHRNHTVIPMEEAAQEIKDLMVNHQAILEKEEEKILVYKAETEKETQDLLKQTEAEMENILGKITEMRRFLEEQEKHMKELKKQIAREREENLAMFDQELSSLKNLIQELKEKCQQPPVELMQDVKSLLQRSQEKKIFEKPVAFSEELKLKNWELRDLKPKFVSVMKQLQGTSLPGLEHQKANITLDPDTAGSYLSLSEDCKRVSCEINPDIPLDMPWRFFRPFSVLGREGFTRGSHFWDVAVESEEDWLVGVAKNVRGMHLIFGAADFCAGGEIWAVGRQAGRYRTTTGLYCSLSEKVKRVRVCLNCDANTVTFYDADTGAKIHTFSEIPFSGETILPFFFLYRKGHLEITP